MYKLEVKDGSMTSGWWQLFKKKPQMRSVFKAWGYWGDTTTRLWISVQNASDSHSTLCGVMGK